jgi:hypothetical protein
MEERCGLAAVMTVFFCSSYGEQGQNLPWPENVYSNTTTHSRSALATSDVINLVVSVQAARAGGQWDGQASQIASGWLVGEPPAILGGAPK